MSGKSTYIRQVALIVILAQMGAYVPAAAADKSYGIQVARLAGLPPEVVRLRKYFLNEIERKRRRDHDWTREV